jgi:hypothetical protein
MLSMMYNIGRHYKDYIFVPSPIFFDQHREWLYRSTKWYLVHQARIIKNVNILLVFVLASHICCGLEDDGDVDRDAHVHHYHLSV